MQGFMTFTTKSLAISSSLVRDVAYVLFEENGELYSLNETGSFIWGLIKDNITIQQIISCVTEAYEGDPQEISDSVNEFVQLLSEHGMILLSDTPFEGVLRNV